MLYNLLLLTTCLFHISGTLALAASAVIGVDLGTEYIKATIVKPGIPLDIVLTKDSRRKEISATAFKPGKSIKIGQFPERVFGSDAIALASRFPGDVYPNLKTLLGLDAEHPIVKEYALRKPKLKLLNEKIRGTVAFKSEAFSAEEIPWTVEEILAMQLQNIQKNAQELAGKISTIKDIVITVPTFFTVEDKRAILLAADLAGFRVLELVSDGLAVGINYATTRSFPSINDGGKPETHLIFDMGAGSTTASVLRFQGRTVKDVGKYNKTIQEIKVLGCGWDKTLGGNLFNSVIVDDIISQIASSPAAIKISLSSETLRGNGKIAARLYKEAEKMRQVLSANANTQAFFEDLYKDTDFKYKITRAEFEKLTAVYATRISATIEKSLEAASLETRNIDSIILHGGASRTPFVQKELEKFFGDTSKIKTNVNSDESAVFGAGFRGAALSSNFRVKEIRVFDSMTYASGVKWTNAHNKAQHQLLWKANSYLGDEKHYAFKNYRDPFALTFYQQIPSEGFPSKNIDQEILTITTQNLTESVNLLKDKYNCAETEITVRLSARSIAESGEVDVTDFVVGCEAEASGEKESVVDSVKGLFGFGKKEQAPLVDEVVSSSINLTPTGKESTSSTSASESLPSATTISSQEDSKGISKEPKLIALKYTTEYKGRDQLPALEITRMKERLLAFSSSDNLRRLRDESLNRLEGFTYKVRELLEDEEFTAVSTEHEKKTLESKSIAASDWIYSGGTEASREELKQRLQELRDIVSPIEFRKAEIASRPEKIISLQGALNETKQLITTITEQIASDKKKHAEFSHSISQILATASPSSGEEVTSSQEEKPSVTKSAPLEQQTLDPPVYTDADLVTPQKLFDEYSFWLNEKLAEQEKLDKTEQPVLISKDLEEKTKKLQNVNVGLLLKNMQQNFKNQNSFPKYKQKKAHNTKNKEDQTSKSSDVPKATFTVSPGEEIPGEKVILEHLKDAEGRRKPIEAEKNETPKGSEQKHEEL